MTATSPAKAESLLHRTYILVVALLTDPKYFYALGALVIFGDVVLTQLVIHFVSYTEIDWETYIYQLELYLNGERDYALITGPTGPIVYPAGHVHIHSLLYKLTDSGKDVVAAQQIYALLYYALSIITVVIYGRAGGIPNWALLLLPLSKRLHSIFVLRLFNDCWNALAAHGAVLAYVSGWDILATTLFGLALSVKMSALLYLPGILVVLFKRHGLVATVGHVLAIVLSQIAIGLPFLLHYPHSYLRLSYEFSRVFLYKWTVNWRFVSEETFLSSSWTQALLFGHLATLIAFGLFKWCRQDGGVWSVVRDGLQRPMSAPRAAHITPDYVATVLFTSNLIGIVFARSLHYQFYSWYARQLPLLLWRTKYPVSIKLVLVLSIEYAWNVFPSTNLSSSVLCASHVLLLLGIWFGYPEGKVEGHEQKRD